MPNTIIPINKTIINKLRVISDNIVATINGQTFNSNDGFKYFAREIIYQELENTYIQAFSLGVEAGRKLLTNKQ